MLSKSLLKYIQSLHHKKFREQHASFLVEGTKMAEEAIRYAASTIQAVYATSEWLNQYPHLVAKFPIPITAADQSDMKRISALQTPPGIVLMMQQPEQMDVTVTGPMIVLDGLQDPGNLGTIIRTADWFGVQTIICGDGTADAYNPKVIQSTMGSIFRTHFLYTELESFFEQHQGVPIIVSHLEGEKVSSLSLPETGFLVIGNESRGVSEAISARADLKVKIPGFGQAESLNASVAAAILLYEWKR